MRLFYRAEYAYFKLSLRIRDALGETRRRLHPANPFFGKVPSSYSFTAISAGIT